MTIPHPNNLMPLGEAKEWLRERVEEGSTCPCCNRKAAIRKRKIHATMARTLIEMLRAGAATKYVHTPSLPGDTHEASQLSWWGLIEEEQVSRPDGGRAGWWRLTERGVAFARNELQLPTYARVWDGKCLSRYGAMVSIIDCLKAKFNYDELMKGI